MTILAKRSLAPALAVATLLFARVSLAQEADPYADDPPPQPPDPALLAVPQPAPSPAAPAPAPAPQKAAPPAKPIDPDTVKPAMPRRHPEKPPSLASRLEWRWPLFTWAQFGISVGQGALAIASVAIPGMHNWSSTNPFDEAARKALRIPAVDSALHARDASDIGLVLLLNQQLVDTLFVTWWYHDKGSTALQMALIDVQTLTFSAGLQSLTAGLSGRERPYGRSICDDGSDEAKSSDCQGANRQRSFFSGHAALSFTLAGLTCAHHINLPLYGGGAVEAAPCAATLAVAAAVSMLRVNSDQHYMSDILVGSAFGLASGFAIPYLFHYAQKPTTNSSAAKAMGVVGFSVAPMPTGAQMAGFF